LKKISKHIAIVLLGIFIIPIIFQSIHIVLHLAHVHGNADLVELYSTKGFDVNKSVCNSKKGSEIHCLICEYKFPVSNAPENCLFECKIFKIENDFIDHLNNSFNLVFFSKKSSRAPPSFFI